jgi:hypothetical protein
MYVTVGTAAVEVEEVVARGEAWTEAAMARRTVFLMETIVKAMMKYERCSR